MTVLYWIITIAGLLISAWVTWRLLQSHSELRRIQVNRAVAWPHGRPRQ